MHKKEWDLITPKVRNYLFIVFLLLFLHLFILFFANQPLNCFAYFFFLGLFSLVEIFGGGGSNFFFLFRCLMDERSDLSLSKQAFRIFLLIFLQGHIIRLKIINMAYPPKKRKRHQTSTSKSSVT